MSDNKIYCGFIAIIGRSNVGKSSLLNKLLGKKVSITSNKVKTTRHHILGISTKNEYQSIYIDTPGLQVEKECCKEPLIKEKRISFLRNVDLAIFVIENICWTLDDEIIVRNLQSIEIPIILAVNKIDNLHKKTDLLPHLRFLNRKVEFLDIVPVSAKTGMNVDIVSSIVKNHLPKKKHLFPPEKVTDCSHHFMASEIIREKLMRFLGDELPYSVFVDIEYFQYNENTNYAISALIFVRNIGQKKIIIGNKGTKIKLISIEARKGIEKMFNAPVYLKLWVKTKEQLK